LGGTIGLTYLSLCPQWTYLIVFTGYIADEPGNEYLV
jgi:hypothetical protein